MVMDLSPARHRSQAALPLLWTDICSGPSNSIPAAGHFLWQLEAWGGQLPHVTVPVGLRWACFLHGLASPRAPPPNPGLPWLVGPGWHEPSGSSSAGCSALAALPLLPACCFEVGPGVWLCRAALWPVIRHVRSQLYLLITARSAGAIASPQTTFPRPRGRESLPQQCPQGCGPGAWAAGGTACPVYKALLGARVLLDPCVLPGHCLPTTACLLQQDLS